MGAVVASFENALAGGEGRSASPTSAAAEAAEAADGEVNGNNMLGLGAAVPVSPPAGAGTAAAAAPAVPPAWRWDGVVGAAGKGVLARDADISAWTSPANVRVESYAAFLRRNAHVFGTGEIERKDGRGRRGGSFASVSTGNMGSVRSEASRRLYRVCGLTSPLSSIVSPPPCFTPSLSIAAACDEDARPKKMLGAGQQRRPSSATGNASSTGSNSTSGGGAAASGSADADAAPKKAEGGGGCCVQ